MPVCPKPPPHLPLKHSTSPGRGKLVSLLGMTSKALRADVSELVRKLGKTCLLITHRIDDAIEMADRILVLAIPARVMLEIRPTAAQRADPAQTRELHQQIAAAMGDDEQTTH